MDGGRWTESMAAVHAVLPRTECGACGEAGCRPFARVVVDGRAAAEDCPPGGTVTALRIGRLLGRASSPARDAWKLPVPPALLARVREADCIGCTRCIAACPVDAILGAPHQMHVILNDACTGCGLCVPPCPTDCIEIEARAQDGVYPDPALVAAIERRAAGECTSCGDCAPACPEALDPQALYRAIALDVDPDGARALRLADCTECRRCDKVCPSRIPLAHYFTHGKAVVEADVRARARAAAAAAAVERSAARRTRQAGAADRRRRLDEVRDRAALREEIDAAVARAGGRRARGAA